MLFGGHLRGTGWFDRGMFFRWSVQFNGQLIGILDGDDLQCLFHGWFVFRSFECRLSLHGNSSRFARLENLSDIDEIVSRTSGGKFEHRLTILPERREMEKARRVTKVYLG